MKNKRWCNDFSLVVLAVFGLALLGGCTHADPGTLEAFVADLIRNAASALLL